MKHPSQQPISSHHLQESLSATWMEAEPQVLSAQPCHDTNRQNDYVLRSKEITCRAHKNKWTSIIPSLS
jgi:hypothetical protein